MIVVLEKHNLTDSNLLNSYA